MHFNFIFKLSILNATNRDSVCSIEGGHVGSAAIENQEARTSTENRAAPIEAAGTSTAERTIAAVAVTRPGQFKRRAKSAGCAVGATYRRLHPT